MSVLLLPDPRCRIHTQEKFFACRKSSVRGGFRDPGYFPQLVRLGSG
jgi:hypothetical protein